jgi:hypothetical protein
MFFLSSFQTFRLTLKISKGYCVLMFHSTIHVCFSKALVFGYYFTILIYNSRGVFILLKLNQVSFYFFHHLSLFYVFCHQCFFLCTFPFIVCVLLKVLKLLWNKFFFSKIKPSKKFHFFILLQNVFLLSYQCQAFEVLHVFWSFTCTCSYCVSSTLCGCINSLCNIMLWKCYNSSLRFVFNIFFTFVHV